MRPGARTVEWNIWRLRAFRHRRGPGRSVKLFSERWPLKYLVSDHGVCLGVDTVRCSYLFLASREGLRLQRRPVGDTVVEDLDYEIPAIVNALEAESGRAGPGFRP